MFLMTLTLVALQENLIIFLLNPMYSSIINIKKVQNAKNIENNTKPAKIPKDEESKNSASDPIIIQAQPDPSPEKHIYTQYIFPLKM